MDFALTDRQEALRGLAREIFQAASSRASGRRSEEGPAPEAFDPALWADLASAGLLGVAVPEEAGGAGGGFLDLCMLFEEAGRWAVSAPLVASLAGAALPVARFGSSGQRTRYLPGVADGTLVLTSALPETALEDPSVTSVAAARDGGLYGVCPFVPAAGVAHGMVVPARTADGNRMVAVVELAADGVDVAGQPTSGGGRLFRVSLAGVRAADVLGDTSGDTSGGPGGLVTWAAERVAVGLCAFEVGLAERALRMTADYTSKREQFGRPLATFQAVQQRAADAYIDVEAMRVTAWAAAWRLGEELPALREVAVAKFWAAEGGHRVLAAAQHLHGGIGVDTDYPLHRYTLAAKQAELTLGGANASLARLGRAMAGPGWEDC